MTAADVSAPEFSTGSEKPSDTPDGGRIWAMFNPHRAWGDRTTLNGFLSQVVLICIASFLYWGVRGITKDQAAAAFRNADRIVEFERSLGLDLEATAQGLILESDLWIAFFNWIYMFLHWPVIVGVLVWTFVKHRREYVLYRDAIMVSGVIGLVFFALYPVAPPRLWDTSTFFDSVTELSMSYKILQPQGIVNQFAALPSFHVGWNILAGVALYRSTNNRVLRAASIASPTLMTLAVVFTANHWVVDVFAGSAIAGVALVAAWLIRRRALRTNLSPVT